MNDYSEDDLGIEDTSTAMLIIQFTVVLLFVTVSSAIEFICFPFRSKDQ